MLYALSKYLVQYHSFFRVFDYLSLRGILAIITAMLLCLVLGPRVIRRLIEYKIGEKVRDLDQLTNHKTKGGTPTMGGALILIAIAISTLLWADLSNGYIWVLLIVTLGFAAIGAYDDYRKLVGTDKESRRGLSAKHKYLLQSLIAISASLFLYHWAYSSHQTQFVIPFLKTASIHIGLAYIVISYFVIMGSTNAVNLTDGLDGLAIMPTILIAGALGVFAYASGNEIFAHYLLIPYLPGTGEVVVFIGALMGAGLGFLWFNAYPAMVFMGDIGSLSLGAALGVIAVIVREEIIFFIMSGVFVMEALSVMLQVGSYKLRNGKRIFKMAPIHHHFELKGWPEPRIIVRFWIITMVLVLIGLATLKLR